ncbi:MAG: GNAT family N-acetyltransferase [Acidimicrobiia bacterium]
MRPLTGPRIALRPLRAGDWEAWREIRLRNHDWLERWEPRPEPGAPDAAADREAFRARCGAMERQRHFDTAYSFGVFLRSGGRLIGEVSLGSVQRGAFQSAYLGYWIDEEYAGQGYIPESVVVLLRHGFEDLRLHRIQASIVPHNAPSRRVAEKLGLRDEGVAVGYLQIQGEWLDHIRYAITADEWQERSEALVAAYASKRATPTA